MKNNRWPEDIIKKPGSQMRSVWSIDEAAGIEKEGVVWDINTPRAEEKIFGKHPTQKPIDLLKRIVLASTNKGDLVLDPFAGSSTTGLATFMLGRKFIGVDLEEKYLELSEKRFKALEQAMKSKLI